MKFDYDDCKFYADKLRGKCNTSGPWWSTLLRFVPMFDEITRLRSILKEAKEDAERLAKKNIIYGAAKECIYCHKWEMGLDEIKHAPDCPITLHTALMEKLKQEGIE